MLIGRKTRLVCVDTYYCLSENGKGIPMAVSFAAQIAPLFRDSDVNAMIKFGHFNLRVLADVRVHADDILRRLTDGDMPCDAPWPATQVALFSQWIRDGKQP
jgi:hypothetical protein